MSLVSLINRCWAIPVNVYRVVCFYVAWLFLLINAFQQRIHLVIAWRFRQYGFFAARHPYSLIAFSVVAFLINSYPLTEISWTEYPPLEFVESSMPGLPVPTWFKGEASSLAVLMPISVSLTFQPRLSLVRPRVSLDSGSICSPVRTASLSADRIIQALTKSSSLPMQFDEACFKVQTDKSTVKEPFSSSVSDMAQGINGCFYTAPLTSLDSFKQITRLLDEKDIISSKSLSNATLPEFAFDLTYGLPFSATGIPALYSSVKHVKHLCASAVGHTVHFVIFAFFSPGRNASIGSRRVTDILLSNFPRLHEEVLHAVSEAEVVDDNILETFKNEAVNRPAYIYFRSWNWMEFFPILAIYIALLGYIYFSLTKIAMVKSKAGLAFGAVFGIGASFLVAVGICTRLGLTIGYFFSVTDVFPYVVVLNGLENIVIMTTAVTNCRREFKCDVPHCIAMGLELEGFRMVKHVFLAAFVSIIGVLTGVPQIRDFFLMALIGLCTDLLFQLVFFSAVLAIDIKRIELEEQCRGQVRIHQRQRSTGDMMMASTTNSSETISLFTLPWSIISPSSTNAEGDNQKGLSKSLAWFHSRRFSSIGAVFAILFITILYLESYNGGVYYQLIVSPVIDTFSRLLNPTDDMISPGEVSQMTNKSFGYDGPATFETPLASEWWRNLRRGYFQKLFSATCGISLTHRYLTIVRPLEIHAHVPLETIPKVEETSTPDQILSSPPSTTVTLSPENKLLEEPISSQVLVVILIVLSLSVIVNLSLLLYTCLRRRFRPRNSRQYLQHRSHQLSFSSAFDLVSAPKQPTQVLRVTPVVSLNHYVSAICSKLNFSTADNVFHMSPSGQNLTSVNQPDYANSLVVAHSSDGVLTVLDPDSGEIQCQMRRRGFAKPASVGANSSPRPDVVEQSVNADSTFPCWALASGQSLLYISGSTPAIEIYALSRVNAAADLNASLKMSFLGTYSSSISSAAIHAIQTLPGDALVALAFTDGNIDVVQGNSESSQNFKSIFHMRMRAPLLMAVSQNLMVVGSSDGCIRVFYISVRHSAVNNCSTIYLSPRDNNTSTSACSVDQISSLAVDSCEPAGLAVGTSSGSVLLYELVPKSDMLLPNSSASHFLVQPSSDHSASANLVFSTSLPRPLLSSYRLATSNNVSSQMVSAISRIVLDVNICLAVNSSGSVCVINRRRIPPVVVGILHPKPVVSIQSQPMSPVLDVVIIPNVNSNGGGPTCSLFASAHSDGRLLLWAVRDQFPSPAGMSLICVATAQSPVISWPIEQLHVVQSHQSTTTSQLLVFSARNKICRADIPTNVNYTN